MKNKLVWLFLLLLTLMPSPVFGQTVTPEENHPGWLFHQNIQNQVEKQEKIHKQDQMHREEFLQRLAEIKDEKKQAIVERIDKQLAWINQKVTSRMKRHLSHLTALLDKLSSRVEKAKAAGRDTAAAEAAIQQAQTAIDEASRIVEAQAAKDYVLNFVDENDLRATAHETKVDLRADLTTAYEAVKAARQAVVKALKTVKEIQKIDEVE